MAEKTIQDDHPELPPKSAPKPEREPIVIDGKAIDVTPAEPDLAPGEPAVELESHVATAAEPEGDEAAPEAPPAEPEAKAPSAAPESHAVTGAEPASAATPEPEPMPPGPPPTDPPATAAEPASSSLGRMIGLGAVVLIAVLIGVFVPPLFTGDRNGADERLGAVEAALKDDVSARKALETRVVALETKPGLTPPVATPNVNALEARVAKLEASAASAPGPAAAKPEPTPTPSAPATNAAPPVAARIDTALADRVAKLEVTLAAPKAAPAPDPEIARLSSVGSALADRIAKLEAALAVQKSEARAEPLAVAKRLDPVAVAVAAISLAQRLDEGEPYATEFAALGKAGADAGALAALKPYADFGAPTTEKLNLAFAKLAPRLTTPAKSEAKGEIVDKMMDQLRGLVKVHAVSEIPGDDPAALTSQISAELGRGDVAAALKTEAKLPDAARAAAAAWVQDASGLENAKAAARSLAETALKRFADAKN